LCVVVRIDSNTPLDLPDEQRFKASPPSFRDHLDDIYYECKQRWAHPPVSRYRRAELEKIQRRRQVAWADDDKELDDSHGEQNSWEVILDAGSTWCLL